MVVVMIVLAIIVEPRLNSFCEVFAAIDRRILPLPQTGIHGSAISLLQTSVKRRINVLQASQMDVVSDFMNQDILGGIRIAGIAEQIFFTA